MGHREQLLSAARRCLEERGYAHTTARDLVAASGTNLASIGYHFGSKDELLTEALIAAFAEYTEVLLDIASGGGDDDPLSRVRQAWTAMVDAFERMRPLLIGCIEALAQAERNPALRAQLAEAYERYRSTIAAAATALVPDLSERSARDLASFMIVVADGLMVQWLLDPDNTPRGGDLFDAVRLVFARAGAP